MSTVIIATGRGFPVCFFRDSYGSECSIQDSSAATEPKLWLGIDKNFNGQECTRMHLTQQQAANLLPLIDQFVRTGSITGAGE